MSTRVDAAQASQGPRRGRGSRTPGRRAAGRQPSVSRHRPRIDQVLTHCRVSNDCSIEHANSGAPRRTRCEQPGTPIGAQPMGSERGVAQRMSIADDVAIRVLLHSAWRVCKSHDDHRAGASNLHGSVNATRPAQNTTPAVCNTQCKRRAISRRAPRANGRGGQPGSDVCRRCRLLY